MAWVTLPAFAPIVKIIRCVLTFPVLPILHSTEESDCQVLASHAVYPTLGEFVTSKRPKCLPAAVVQVPATGVFCTVCILSIGRSKENRSDKLPILFPTVIAYFALEENPWPSRAETELSETHSVFSQSVLPNRVSGVKHKAPSPAPWIVVWESLDCALL